MLKVTANERTYRMMEDNMDVDLSAVLRGERTIVQMGSELVGIVPQGVLRKQGPEMNETGILNDAWLRIAPDEIHWVTPAFAEEAVGLGGLRSLEHPKNSGFSGTPHLRSLRPLPSPAAEAGLLLRVRVRIRYRQPLQSATLLQRPGGLYILFDKPQRGITPGQFAVWYSGEVLLGSGVIAE